jgi:hypothetical protein
MESKAQNIFVIRCSGNHTVMFMRPARHVFIDDVRNVCLTFRRIDRDMLVHSVSSAMPNEHRFPWIALIAAFGS